ncbi:hypothetical protein GOP47_0011183 [Adiantum capillus-veneris]|uniref:HVA22-like protein n=1 Tax=Adiantum capillus-veneris TaxID=13818 RepID=A0A9D4USA8_ADICA|nr:hypothetical protein GOP47_0011183 [Adiantum capillus-veneris]
MMGSLITRALIMVVGYVYPAYKCFKCVEMNRPDVEQLRFWCQYWIIIAIVTVLERLGDTFVSWLPLYSEAKLAFIIYLWCPKTLGTTYVYSSFLRPLVATHEGDIDRNLNELTARALDMIADYWQRGSVYAQSRFMEILQFVASQAPARPEQGSGNFQPPPQPPPPPPGYETLISEYHHQLPPAADYSPSAPVIPSDYLYQQSVSAVGTYQPTQPRQQGYPQEMPGYTQPPYLRGELDAPSQVTNIHPLQPKAAAPPPESSSGYMTRRQRTRRQP